MTRADNSHHLLRAAADRRRDALGRARGAIETLDRRGVPITFTTVARQADVSRGWLYRQADLRDTIITLRANPRASGPLGPAGHRATAASLRQRVDGLRAEIACLRDEKRTTTRTCRPQPRRTSNAQLDTATITCRRHRRRGHRPATLDHSR